MGTDRFCGQVCHTVMQPEFVAYGQSPHARVSCVECHIGPGASWFVKSKLSGLGQVVAVATNSYPRPIPSPVTSLRPARETCEQCHWPQRFTGDKVVVHTEYSEDEHNTAATTVLLMKVGGRAWNGTVGIHGAHLADNTRIEYIVTDAKRQVIPQVVYTDASGKQTIYNSTDTEGHARGVGEGRAPHHGLRGLPQPADPYPPVAGASFGRRRFQRPHQFRPTVREEAGLGGAEGELPRPRCRADSDRGDARCILPDALIRSCTRNNARRSRTPLWQFRPFTNATFSRR